MLRRQSLDLLRQPRRVAAGQDQQAVAKFEPERVDAKRVADRRLGRDWNDGGLGHSPGRMLVADVGASPGKPGQGEERQRRQSWQECQHQRDAARQRKRLRVAAELAYQRRVGRTLDSSLRHDDPRRGADQQGRYLADQAVADRQRRERRGRIGERHAVPQQPDREAADDVDDRDQQARHRVTADELRRTVHGAVEAAFLLQLFSAQTRHLLVDPARGELGIDRHLLARHRVEAEARRHLGNSARALGDDHEVHHQQDREQDHADDDIATHQEATERLDHMPGRARTLVAAREDQPRRCHVERQAQQGRQQEQRGEAGEIERAPEEHGHHQHEYRGRDRECQPEIEQDGGQRQDENGQQRDNPECEADVAAREPGPGLRPQRRQHQAGLPAGGGTVTPACA